MIDEILCLEALELVFKILTESIFYYESKPSLEGVGYVGAYMDDGMYQQVGVGG